MDYMARMSLLAVPRLKPDIVVFVFTQAERREYFTREDKCFNYGRGSIGAIEAGVNAGVKTHHWPE
jgi:hypothetical protein